MPFITNYLTDSDHPLRTSQVERGKPTWRRLVEAVEDPVGGNNHALAQTIARQHPDTSLNKVSKTLQTNVR